MALRRHPARRIGANFPFSNWIFASIRSESIDTCNLKVVAQMLEIDGK